MKSDRMHTRVALRKQLQVGNVTTSQQAGADRFREYMALCVEPAIYLGPAAILQPQKCFSAIAKDTTHGGETGSARARCDAVTDGLQLAEAMEIAICHCG